MSIVSYIAICFILAFYGLINYYIGIKGWQILSSLIPFLNSKIYWFIFWLLAFSYIAARFAGKLLPGFVNYILTVTGAYWLGALVYFTLIIAVLKLVTLLDKWMGFLPAWLKQSPAAPISGLIVILAVASILAYGTWNANNPRVRHYDISIPKQAGEISGLHAAVVSDVHLGTIVGKERLKKMVDMINAQKPDIVFIAGDIIDEDIGPFIKQNMSEHLRSLKTKYGVYFSLGNHEYYGGHLEDIVKHLSEAGVIVLRDRYIKIADSFYVAGREDKAAEHSGGKSRKKLSDLTAGIDKNFPVILLDHQPSNLKEPEEQGIDLQLSGHTHRGQMYPFNYITGIIFEDDWGYLKKGSLQVIVSSGFGTWGPPIRVGNKPELVDITIRFTG